MKQVLIERRIKRVRDGTEYRGHVRIGESTINYKLRFSVSISELGDGDSLPEGMKGMKGSG